MEKFSRWDEPTTGINPFVPRRRSCPGNPLMLVLKTVLGLAFALLRLPLLVVLFTLLSVAALLGKLMPLAAASRLVRFLLESPLSYMCLIFLGVYSPHSTTINARRVHLEKAKKAPRRTSPGSGDIIIANSTSFLEVLYLSYKYCPIFVRSSVEGGMERVTVIGALLGAIKPVKATLPDPTSSSVAACIKSAQGAFAGPICFQPELGRSNGRGVLSYGAAAESIGRVVAAIPAASRPVTHTVAFKYPYKYFNPPHTGGSILAHLFWMCFQVHNKMQVFTLPAGYDPQPVDDGSAWSDASRNALVEALGSGGRAVDFGAADFNEFLDAYTNPGKRTKKRDRVTQQRRAPPAARGEGKKDS